MSRNEKKWNLRLHLPQRDINSEETRSHRDHICRAEERLGGSLAHV